MCMYGHAMLTQAIAILAFSKSFNHLCVSHFYSPYNMNILDYFLSPRGFSEF